MSAIPENPPGVWRVALARGFVKELGALERAGQRHLRSRIRHALAELAEDPLRPRPGLDVRPIAGARGTFRLRVGRYRVLYELDLESRRVNVTGIVTREQAYR